MIIADSSAWIDFFRGIECSHVSLLENALINNQVYIGDLIVAELLQGAKSDKSALEIDSIISRLTVVNMVGESIARKAAANYRSLRTNGITIRKTIDVIIATYCIENDATLIHNDRDFDPFERHLGLKVLK